MSTKSRLVDMVIISKHGKDLIMWFLKVKDSELSFFGRVMRWSIALALIFLLVIELSFAYSLIK